jgi:hypothetical protein
MKDGWTDSNGGPLTPAGDWSETCGCAPPSGPAIADSITIKGSPGSITSVQNGKSLWSLVLNDGTPAADFRIDRFDDTGALLDSPMSIVRATGVVTFHDPVMLSRDPVEDMEAATKQFVDAHAFPEAPVDGSVYGRGSASWVPVVTGGPYLPLIGGAISGSLTVNGVLTVQGPNSFVLNGTTGQQRAILGQTSGFTRWQMQLGNQVAEGINNVGSNFSLSAYGSTGSFVGEWLTIARADGDTALNGPVNMNAGAAVNGTLALQGPSSFSLPGGNPGDVLTTNGAAALSWTPQGGGYLPLTGGGLSGGLNFGSATAGSVGDTSRHVSLYGGSATSGTFGFNVTGGRINYSVPLASHVHSFNVAGVEEVRISNSGINLANPGLVSGLITPTAGDHATNKTYVDAQVATRLTDAPSDGQFYTRQNAAWAVAPGGMTDAPNDGTAYARKSVGWAHLTHLDITDWAATLANYYPTSNPSGYQTAAQVTAALAPYALTSSVPVASTTPPLMNGTAAVGTGATWARADHVHASDTSRYAATNPSGYQTAAQVTAVLPVASTVAPLINGTAAAGSSAAWSRGDHVHPTDTSRYAASNPSGFQTAAQVTASLANYLPLAGGTTTGPVTIQAGASPNALSLTIGAGNATILSLYDSVGGNNRSNYFFDHTNQFAAITHEQVVTTLQLDIAGAFNYTGGTGVAHKVGGGSWTAASDDRIKIVLGDYDVGLDEVLAMRPVAFAYKGNDTPTDALGRTVAGKIEPYAGAAPFPASPHYAVATNETTFIGFIAQELEAICPGMVTQTAGFIDGEAVTDLRNVDVSNLVYALVNAVKTLAARVGQLEGVNG